MALIGLRRRRLVLLWRVHRDEQPGMYWYGFVFQLGLGLFCLGNAILMWITPATD
jgi:hypothetical protein